VTATARPTTRQLDFVAARAEANAEARKAAEIAALINRIRCTPVAEGKKRLGQPIRR
jgi:hypothetical protein